MIDDDALIEWDDAAPVVTGLGTRHLVKARRI
jgi:hypothetical protein